jgi:toluene monooxygenase system ferredoxin subunit
VSAVDTWVPAGTLDDLWEGEMLSVNVGDVDLVLINVGGRVFAYDDHCPHQGTSLSGGALDEHVLTCAAHEWVFDVRSGCGVNPADARLQPYPVRLDGDTVLVNLRQADG